MVGRFASIIIICLFCFVSSCDHFKGVPAYLQIDSIALSPASAAKFRLTPTAKIIDAWIIVDGQAMGGFQLPAQIPVLKTGNHTVLIQPGVLVDNMIARRGIYPFYQTIEMNVKFSEDSITYISRDNTGNIKPLIVELKNTNNYVLSEDFEENGIGFDTVNQFHSIVPTYNKSTQDIPVPTPSNLYGDRTAYIHLVKNDSCCIFSKKTFANETALPYNKPIFIELDYLTNNTFEVGIISYKDGKTTFHAIAGAGRQKLNEWNKLYIDISNRVTAQLADNANSFKIFIKASLDNDNAEANIYLDNIRVVF